MVGKCVMNEKEKGFNQLANELPLLLVVITAISSCRRWESEPKGEERETMGSVADEGVQQVRPRRR
jgi:hypothetical protein